MKEFTAQLEIIGINPFVFIPDKVLSEIFIQAGKSKGKIPVCGTINDIPYNQTLLKYKSEWRLYVNLRMLPNSPKRIGEKIRVSISIDETDRTINIHPELLKAFALDTEAKRTFDTQAPSLQKEIIRYISFLKSEESIAKNIKLAIGFLKGENKFLTREPIKNMSLQLSITNSVDYNVWVTGQLVNWLKNNSEKLLQKESSSSFSSIAKTLKHISDTQLYWSSMIRGTATPAFDYIASEVDIQTEMENLVSEATVLATYVKENIASMSQTHLIESEWFTSNFPKYEYLQHLIIHTTYHRGQIVTIGHNVGVVNAPMMDYNFWNVIRQQS